MTAGDLHYTGCYGTSTSEAASIKKQGFSILGKPVSLIVGDYAFMGAAQFAQESFKDERELAIIITKFPISPEVSGPSNKNVVIKDLGNISIINIVVVSNPLGF